MGTEIREKNQKVKEHFIKDIEILKVKPNITPQNIRISTKKKKKLLGASPTDELTWKAEFQAIKTKHKI